MWLMCCNTEFNTAIKNYTPRAPRPAPTRRRYPIRRRCERNIQQTTPYVSYGTLARRRLPRTPATSRARRLETPRLAPRRQSASFSDNPVRLQSRVRRGLTKVKTMARNPSLSMSLSTRQSVSAESHTLTHVVTLPHTARRPAQTLPPDVRRVQTTHTDTHRQKHRLLHPPASGSASGLVPTSVIPAYYQLTTSVPNYLPAARHTGHCTPLTRHSQDSTA
jgi:hypothetical protein